MKILRRRILGTLILFGEILFIITSTQHNHIHDHHHVHHQGNINARQDLNDGAKITTKAVSDLLNPKQFHTHNVQKERSNNTDVKEKNSSNYTKRTTRENNTRDMHKTGNIQTKGASRNANRLRFKDELTLDGEPVTVRQHAAKSITLNCRVKGITRKKYLDIKWFKESKPIKGVMKG